MALQIRYLVLWEQHFKVRQDRWGTYNKIEEILVTLLTIHFKILDLTKIIVNRMSATAKVLWQSYSDASFASFGI